VDPFSFVGRKWIPIAVLLRLLPLFCVITCSLQQVNFLNFVDSFFLPMHTRFAFFLLSGFFILILTKPVFSQRPSFSACNQVDAFWGCDGGNVFVGACSPFGMVRLGPDCPFPTPTSGYQSSKPIIGFSHTHLSGTGGGGRYGNILVTPQFGKPNWKARESLQKENESARPGYYGVDLILKEGRVKVELTAAQNLGRSRFQFSGSKPEEKLEVSLLFDLKHCISRDPVKMFQGCRFQVLKDGSFQGQASFKGGWGGDNPYTIFFKGQANVKNAVLTYQVDSTLVLPSVARPASPNPPPAPKGKAMPKGSGPKVKVVELPKPIWQLDTTGFAFTGLVEKNEMLETSVSISYKGLEETGFALERSLKQSFEELEAKTKQAWEDRLSVFSIETQTPEEKKMFFSSLYHTMIMPTDVSGHHPKDAFGEAHFWEHYCLWDVFRTLMPLHNLVYPTEQRRIMNSLIRIGESRGWLPDAWVAGDFAMAQGGCNAEIVLAEGVAKGILPPSEAAKAWKVCYQNATQPSDHPEWYGRNAQYLKNGFIDSRVVNGTSKSLEYAYNDHIMSQFAYRMGKVTEGNMFRDRSTKVFNLWFPERRFFWSRDSTQTWMPNFTPEYMRKDHWNGPYFYEGNPWTYALSAPHLTDTLIKSMGGKPAWESRLDSTFSGNHFSIGNEPGFMLPYAYLFSGNRAKAVETVHGILKKEFVTGRKGLPGQDDSGALSSWLVWGYMGLYPLAGSDEYWLFQPYANAVEITLPGGKYMAVSGKGKRVFLNGKEFKSLKIKHADLLAGGKIEWKD